MEKINYPAMVYKNNRNNVYVANCIVKNLIGFGKTEEAALVNLRDSLQNLNKDCEVFVTPMYGFSIAQ